MKLPPNLQQILAGGLVQRIGESDRPGRLTRPTGLGPVDRVLPGGGLRAGATHEWFGYALPDGGERGDWFAPLTILCAIAVRAACLPVIFIGRRCWPAPGALCAALDRCLFVDPPDDASRLWAIDQALRCPGVGAVLADASRVDMAGSRRLQLAAERGGRGGAIGLLIRPPWEHRVISAAETRWRTTPAPGARACWSVELLRCKGAPLSAAQGAAWLVEWTGEVGHDACALRVPADVVGGPDQAAGRAVG